jgi:hypothetical protein|tara:strand:+ start:8560 stop:9183 length:624 start_codon:yes stop_codon:yes gene_type:complete
MSRFNFADYLRFKETSKLSREIEKQKKEESERLIKTNERNDLLRKAYGKRNTESKALPTQINFNPFFYKKLKPSAPLPRHPDPKKHHTFEQLPTSPVIKQKNQFNVKIDTKKKPVENNVYFSKAVPSHREYETFKKSEYIYKPLVGLPAMGWIQRCILCSNLTTSVEEIYPYKLYCCNRCQKQYSEKRKLRKASLIAIEANNYRWYQ